MRGRRAGQQHGGAGGRGTYRERGGTGKRRECESKGGDTARAAGARHPAYAMRAQRTAVN
ncbi:hypothetical protein BOC52_04340 [Burkholderia pseudomallei]|nr:hypothetical protein BK015_25015 [Burkholderia pseudomallei]ARK43001.1 hypothetical protein BOC60_22365 [Burkholderia pseudomallei]ARL18510.1 hypothetical protein BOC46_23755 [Burkholderia pseudomallei]ARL40043.1 hypothetical protein BOC49_28715 [Burkholderia pseudomallei]ARL55933.1 hypothetical protein BOC52_04340 [Burkholderia pseudomallei]